MRENKKIFLTEFQMIYVDNSPPGDRDNLPPTLNVGWTFKEQSVKRGT